MAGRLYWTFATALVYAISFHSQTAGATNPSHSEALGNVSIKWDVMSWTGDGYGASVTIQNYQSFQAIKRYELSWSWSKKEVIYVMVGARATEMGGCTGLPAPPPHSCVRNPTIIDLVPGVPYAQQVANCCRNGFIAPAQNPEKPAQNSVSAFSMTVGRSGNTNQTIAIPRKLSLASPAPDYTCDQLRKAPPTEFPSPDGKRVTRAYLTWKATCTFSG